MTIFFTWQYRSFESSISHGGRASELLLFVGDNFIYYLVLIPYGKTNSDASISLWTCFIHSLTLDDAKVLFIVAFV